MMHPRPGEVMGRGAAIRRREVAIRETVESDGRDRDRRLRGQLILERIVGQIAGRESEAMTIGMKHDLDIVRIVEGGGGSFQRRVIESGR